MIGEDFIEFVNGFQGIENPFLVKEVLHPDEFPVVFLAGFLGEVAKLLHEVDQGVGFFFLLGDAGGGIQKLNGECKQEKRDAVFHGIKRLFEKVVCRKLRDLHHMPWGNLSVIWGRGQPFRRIGRDYASGCNAQHRGRASLI